MATIVDRFLYFWKGSMHHLFGGELV